MSKVKELNLLVGKVVYGYSDFSPSTKGVYQIRRILGF